MCVWERVTARERERERERYSETIDKCGLVPKCVRIIGPKLMIDIEREAESIILNGLKGWEINR